MDTLQIRKFNRSQMARTLHCSPRTFDRRRNLGIYPREDERDEGGHPLWYETTAREILAKRRPQG
jgi:hypothetical protein